jgi:cbb3-type cytochrome oxidase maturation protein
MDILYLLIPLSVVAMLALLGLFAWALHGGQLDNLASEGERILWTDSQAPAPAATHTPARPADDHATKRNPEDRR